MELSHAARRILDRFFAIAQQIPGTNEVRTLMRYHTHAARIALGVPLFITWSPDEKHNLIMIRLSRARQKDPATLCEDKESLKRCSQRHEPAVDTDLSALSLEEL